MSHRAGLRTLALLCGALALLAACAAPAVTGDRPAPQRTADARLRVLTSGTPAVPPRPTATLLAAPTCPGAVWWFDAASRVGQRATVQGPVAAARTADGELLLDLGQPFPDPNRAVARLEPAGPVHPDAYAGKSVCATGTVSLVDGVATVDAGSGSVVAK